MHRFIHIYKAEKKNLRVTLRPQDEKLRNSERENEQPRQKNMTIYFYCLNFFIAKKLHQRSSQRWVYLCLRAALHPLGVVSDW